MTLKDRMTRAEDYVFGLMDEHERERAERDMEVDTEFRDCVAELAERLRRLRDAPGEPDAIPASQWNDISSRIASMPQMGGALPAVTPRDETRKPAGRGLHETGGRRGLFVALALAIAFAIGYFAGRLD